MIRTTIKAALLITFLLAGNAKGQSAVTPTAFIPKDSANKMIGSFLASAGAPFPDSNLRSWTIDMDQIELYNSAATGSNKIKKLEIKLAHTLEYINSGHSGQNAGYRNDALTVVIAGINAEGNYVYYGTDMVIDHSSACPHNCPPGAAQYPFLTK